MLYFLWSSCQELWLHICKSDSCKKKTRMPLWLFVRSGSRFNSQSRIFRSLNNSWFDLDPHQELEPRILLQRSGSKSFTGSKVEAIFLFKRNFDSFQSDSDPNSPQWRSWNPIRKKNSRFRDIIFFSPKKMKKKIARKYVNKLILFRKCGDPPLIVPSRLSRLWRIANIHNGKNKGKKLFYWENKWW